ncbi:MAG: hypothetical protein RLZZ96_1027 [Bacteroidota bacterium]
MKKSIFNGFIIALCLSFSLKSQVHKYVQLHDEYYDNKPVHFGFMISHASTNFLLGAAPKYLSNAAPSLALNASSPKTSGFQIGGTVNYAYDKHYEVRSGLNIALYERQIEFNEVTPTGINTTKSYFRESTWLEIPVNLKYRSLRRKNHRIYIMGGFKLGIEANVKRTGEQIQAKTTDVSLEYGFGFEQFYKFFKFNPELKFSHGVNNLYLSSLGGSSAFSRFNQYNSHTISLVFYFE